MHCRVIPVHVGLLQHVNAITTLLLMFSLSFCTYPLKPPFYSLSSFLSHFFSHLSLSLSAGTRLPVKGPTTSGVIGGLIGVVLLLAVIGSVVVLVRKKRNQHNGE